MAWLKRLVDRFVKEGCGKSVSAAISMNQGVFDEGLQEELVSATSLENKNCDNIG